MTHSHSGGIGWLTAIENQHVKAIVSYEPGSGFVFPAEELSEPIASSSGPLEAMPIAKADFLKWTKIPIIIYYGDNIPAKLDKDNPGADGWRAHSIHHLR